MKTIGWLRGLRALTAHALRSLGRIASRHAAASRLVLRTAAQGGSLRLGANVVVQHPELVQCGQRVALADGVELLAGVSPGQSGPSIVLGSGVKIGRRSQLAAGPGRIVIGAHASLHTSTYLLGHVHVGRYTLLSANIFASSGDHHAFDTPHLPIRDQDVDARSRASGTPQPVVIDEDCWIGWSVAIKRGVHVGRGAVVGANAVVTRDVPPYAVIAGQPARVIRKRLELRPLARIVASDDESGPYLYRGFRQSREERAGCSRRCPGHVWALRETVLLMAHQEPGATLVLRGSTVDKGSSLSIEVGDRTATVVLPVDSHTAFSIHLALDSLQHAASCTEALPLPKLDGFDAIRITAMHSATADTHPGGEERDLQPYWAFESAELASPSLDHSAEHPC